MSRDAWTRMRRREVDKMQQRRESTTRHTPMSRYHHRPFTPCSCPSFCSSNANLLGFFIGLSGLGFPSFALPIEAIDVAELDRECAPGEDERSMLRMRRRDTTGLQGADCVGVVVLPS